MFSLICIAFSTAVFFLKLANRKTPNLLLRNTNKVRVESSILDEIRDSSWRTWRHDFWTAPIWGGISVGICRIRNIFCTLCSYNDQPVSAWYKNHKLYKVETGILLWSYYSNFGICILKYHTTKKGYMQIKKKSNYVGISLLYHCKCDFWV